MALEFRSGRAVLTMPILVPLSDLLGLSRQVTVLAYQYGPGLFGQFSPTDGALMATLALTGVRYEEWGGSPSHSASGCSCSVSWRSR